VEGAIVEQVQSTNVVIEKNRHAIDVEFDNILTGETKAPLNRSNEFRLLIAIDGDEEVWGCFTERITSQKQ
jgi:hypothetical protein